MNLPNLFRYFVAQKTTPASAATPQIGNTMSFLSVLSAIGKGFQKGVNVAIGLEAKALPVEQLIANDVAIFNPALGLTLQGAVAVLGRVEQVATALNVSTGTGPQKLAAAIPDMETAILSDPIFKGKTIADLPKWNAAIIQFTSALADMTNSVVSATAPATPAVNAAAPVAQTPAAALAPVVSLTK